MSTTLEWIATLVAFASILLTVLEIRVAWVVTAIASGLFGALFLNSGIFFQASLQLFFIAMSVYGWWSWRPEANLKIMRISIVKHGAIIAAITLACWAITACLYGKQISLVTYLDAWTSLASVAATLLATRKERNSWLYWIAINIASAYLFAASSLYLTSFIYVCFMVLAIMGYRRWKIPEFTEPLTNQ